MGLDDVARKDTTGTDGAIIGALRTGESIDRPSKWTSRVGVHQRVLLFNAEPRLVALHDLVHGFET